MKNFAFQFSFKLFIAQFLCFSVIACHTHMRALAEKPNVVLIYIDDLGYGDIGCFGCTDIPTPNIDQLAKEGVCCTASYICNPPCCPSRCSLMVGQYAQRFGKYGMSRGLAIPEDRPTIAKYLSERGYVTGQIGKWDVGTKLQGPLQVGFTEVAKIPPPKKYSNSEIDSADKANKKLLEKRSKTSKYFCLNEQGETVWLTDYDGDSMVNFIERNNSEPFFLYWSPAAVHSSNREVPERLMKRTQAVGTRRKLAGGIVAVDDQVGKLLKVLEEQGLRENTLVIFTSDNGPNIGEKGTASPYTGGKGEGTQKEGWVRVPTIFSMPKSLPQGERYHGLMANFDFYSTISSLTQGEIPEHCDGVDMFPFLKGTQKDDAHEYLFWLNNQPDDAVRRHLIAVRWGDWRLYKKYEKDPWQLFELKKDPREEMDVAAENANVVQRLAAEHARWTKTLAPLGTIPNLKAARPLVPKGHGWARLGD
ncbi:MAG: sulfatase-like hydrolase/transferase [Planctomycetota bacterium]